ncbi:component of SufBCD complex [Loktanella sp. M215]|uniref:component of SufBCD complex n=1 Tax=Loktanella sp. M215 TaxID=2675431 RepID=UPI001F15F2C4|nr:component of SufBCD complex [Loktanella sp. M215]MBU2360277.1 component of SufBCD complex [Alphaproteobacteria bacterium]MCF7700572.1 component of SufBCD complex [Loktanella sp. M215]
MDWNNILFQVIDLRSFSSVWYWIMLAVLWSSMSYYVLGVPFDLITKARRRGGQEQDDMVDLVRINVNRLLNLAQTTGPIMIGVVSFILTTLALLGFVYGIELAQATFLVALPLSIVGAISLSSARRIRAADPEPEQLYAMLMRHRLWTQIIGMVAIFVTAMYGMFQLLGTLRGL